MVLRDLDQQTKALQAAVADAVRIMREVADDPAQSEGDLRDHLRQGAKFAEQLAGMNATLIAMNRRQGLRFGWLSLLFIALAGLWWFRSFAGG